MKTSSFKGIFNCKVISKNKVVFKFIFEMERFLGCNACKATFKTPEEHKLYIEDSKYIGIILRIGIDTI